MSRTERIYVGGLDPTRGLTVELVVDRLRRVEGVQILSVDDDNDDNDHHNDHNDHGRVRKRAKVFDDEGNWVDDRHFFFLEAKPASPPTTSPSGPSTSTAAPTPPPASTAPSVPAGPSGPAGPSPPSALDLLARQYHNTKWKGCQLRIERARPHFLRRLEDERIERMERIAQIDKAKLKPTEPSKLTEQVEQAELTENSDTATAKLGLAAAVVQPRRRLRIRKRFGEEAFPVDTRPHLLELALDEQWDQRNDDQYNVGCDKGHDYDDSYEEGHDIGCDGGHDEGWEQFTQLQKRMRDKRTSQWKKLVMRRKEERRLWASGKGQKGNSNSSKDNAEGASNQPVDLRSFMFLNRGIHIRFTDQMERHPTPHPVEEEKGKENRLAEMEQSVSTSSESEGSESSEDSENSEEWDESISSADRKGAEADAYVWSDEDEDDNEDDANKDDDEDGGDKEEEKFSKKNDNSVKRETYVWSDEEEGSSDIEEKVGKERESSVSSEESEESKDIDQNIVDSEDDSERGISSTKRKLGNKAEYSKAGATGALGAAGSAGAAGALGAPGAMDEFSGGLEFDTPFDDGDHDGNDDHDDHDGHDNSDEDDRHELEEGYDAENLKHDIQSNLGILSSILGEEIDTRVLADSIDAGMDDRSGGATADREGTKHSSMGGFGGFGGGVIMQRYDPTKEEDKKYELGMVKQSVKEHTALSVSKEVDRQKESAKEKQSTHDSVEPLSEEPIADPKTHSSAASTKPDASMDERASPTKKEIYNQSGLETVFRDAREGKSQGFSLASVFDNANNANDANRAGTSGKGSVGGQNDEEAKGVKDEKEVEEAKEAKEAKEVYEQAKLEDIFRQAREDTDKGTNSFSFGALFQNQLPADEQETLKKDTDASAPKSSFSFGFRIGDDERKTADAPVDDAKFPQSNKAQETAEKTEGPPSPRQEQQTQQPQQKQPKLRTGMTLFTLSELDAYEQQFFQMNEGPQIIQDLEAMRQDSENQERWQKERAALTADWKRKHKFALSRKGKKVRR